MKEKSIAKRLISLFLCVIMLSSFITSFPSSAENEPHDTDFSAPNEEKVTVSPSQILGMLYPDTVTDAEALYVDKYFDTVFLYSNSISPENLSVTVSGSGITVYALPKIYTAENGTTVEWIPVSAKCGANTALLEESGDVYSCDFTSFADTVVTVEYECSVSLPESYVSALANFAYNDKLLANRVDSEYDQAAKRYIEYLKELDEYNDKMAVYGEYLEQKAIYDESLARYNRYLAALTQYNKDLVAYNAYVEAMKTYETEKAAYEKAYAENTAEYEEYKRYLENLQKIRTSMYALESMFVRPQNGVGPLFNALQNKELVSMIEKYDDELVTLYGVKRENIETMRTVSDELNELLKDYSDARDESEEAAFQYYRENYSEICEKFNYLYDKMTAVLTDTIYIHVCALIEVEYKSDPEMATYKKWRIRNVLCHIYLICHVLDDSVTAPEVWDFYLENGEKHSYNFSDLLGQNVILSDTDSADPQGLEWWSGEIPAGDLPKAPVRPAEVKEPVQPLEVKKPTKITVVAHPGDAPEAVQPPSASSDIENYDILLRTEYYLSDTTLTQRAAPDSMTVTFRRAVNRPFSDSAMSVYYSYDGDILSTDTEPSAPTRADTAQYTYSFKKWEEITCDNGDTLYLPVFEHQLRTYTVRFGYSGSDIICSKEYSYGETPVYSEAVPVKADTNTALYAFSGWSPQISDVTEDITYIATFTETERLYKVNWNILGTTQTRYFTYNADPVIPSVRDEAYSGGTLYTFKGWDKTPTRVTEEAEYTAQFTETKLAAVSTDAEGTLTLYKSDTAYSLTATADKIEIFQLMRTAKSNGCDVHITTDKISLTIPYATVSSLADHSAYELSIISSEKGAGYKFTGVNGNDIRFSGDVRASLACTDSQAENPLIIADGKSRVSCTAYGNSVEFKARSGVCYSVSRYYTLTVKYGKGGAVFAPANLYPADAPLELEVFPNAEFVVSKVTLSDKHGKTVELDSAEGLSMPEYDATLTVEFDVKKYEIKFMSGGEVIETQYYALGETVIAPEIPLSFERDGFLYTFIGWSKPLGIVTGNDTYTAKYYSVLIEEVVEADTQTAINKVLVDQVLPIVLIILAVAAVITVTVVVIRKKKKPVYDSEETEDAEKNEKGDT